MKLENFKNLKRCKKYIIILCLFLLDYLHTLYKRVHINSGYLTYSIIPPSPDEIEQIDNNGTSTKLPLVEPTTERQKKQYSDAVGRRRVRMQRSAITANELDAPEWHPILSRYIKLILFIFLISSILILYYSEI